MATKLWYYCDTSGHQQGPVPDKDLITEYNAGHLKEDCLIWSDSLADWTPFSQVEEVYAQIQQTKTKTLASAKMSAAAPKFGIGAPAKSNLVEEMAKKSMENLQQQKGKTSASANVWTKVVGADGYPYYTNNDTHETTWDRPDGYHSEDEAVQEQQPVAEVKMLSTKSTAAKVPAATSSSASEIADLKALITSLKADLEQTSSSLRDTMKANEKAQQDKIQAQEKLIADLKAEVASCKSDLKDIKSQMADCQKSQSSMQASVKSASDSVSELRGSFQTQVKQIKSFAKSLADNLKE